MEVERLQIQRLLFISVPLGLKVLRQIKEKKILTRFQIIIYLLLSSARRHVHTISSALTRFRVKATDAPHAASFLLTHLGSFGSELITLVLIMFGEKSQNRTPGWRWITDLNEWAWREEGAACSPAGFIPPGKPSKRTHGRWRAPGGWFISVQRLRSHNRLHLLDKRIIEEK